MTGGSEVEREGGPQPDPGERAVVDSNYGNHFLSTTSTPHQPRSVILFEDRASHVDDRFNEAIFLCRETILDLPELHHLAHYTKGICNFAFDVLADPTPRFDLLTESIDSIRSDCQQIGGQLSCAVSDLDQELQKACTGALIRAVLHAPRGMICCCSVVSGEYVVGLTLDASALPRPDVPLSQLTAAKAVDIATAQLATSLRQQLRLQPLNPGSWISPKPVNDKASMSHRPITSTARDGSPHIEGAEDDEVVELFIAAVHPDDLHYLAYCRDGEVTFSVDQLGHPDLGLFFTQIKVKNRRGFYREFCRQLPVTLGQLSRMVGSAIGGRLDRVILDVEQGAIYCYRVRPREYLVGVTINQYQVSQADDKMASLVLAYHNRVI